MRHQRHSTSVPGPGGKIRMKSSLNVQWPLLGMALVFVGTLLHAKFQEIQVPSSPPQPINLSRHPYIFDFTEALEQRKVNAELYEFPVSDHWIDRRSGLSQEEFWDLYDAKWPVLVTDVVPSWPAASWSWEFFLSNYPDQPVVVQTAEGAFHKASSSAMTVKEFAQLLQELEEGKWAYLMDELFLPSHPELMEQILPATFTMENFFDSFPSEVKPWDCMLLWGSPGSRSQLHIDPYNWTGTNAVLQGHKKWKLFPPGQDHLLYIVPGAQCGFPLDCLKYNSQVDSFEVDDTLYPEFHQAKYLEFEQKAGEILIIPSGWFHQAYNMEETIAVSGQIMNRNNYLTVLEEILKAKNLQRSALPAFFHTLLPPEQVEIFLSLLPKAVLKQGRRVTERVRQQMVSPASASLGTPTGANNDSSSILE